MHWFFREKKGLLFQIGFWFQKSHGEVSGRSWGLYGVASPVVGTGIWCWIWFCQNLGDLARGKTTPQNPTLFIAGLPPYTLLSAHPLSSFQNRFGIKFTGGQNPTTSLGSPALNKMAIFLQSRAFPLTGTLFFTPPPRGLYTWFGMKFRGSGY